MKIKKIAIYSFFLVTLIYFGCTTENQKSEEQSIVFRNISVIDAKNGLQTNLTVVIKGKRIYEIKPADEIEIDENAIVVDGSGKFLIPGLWDAHVHLSYEPELTSSMFQLFLVNGITSIRDTGGQLDLVMPLKVKAEQDPEKSPRVMVAGPLLDGVPTVYDGISRPKLGLGAGTPEEAERLIEDFVNAGVDFIKSYEMLTPQTFESVIAKSKSYGKIVTGHVPLSMDVIEASDLGLRSMEHMRNLEMACSSNFDSLLDARRKMLDDGKNEEGGILRSRIHQAQRSFAVQNQDEQRRNLVLSRLADNQTWQIPTLSIVTVSSRRPFGKESWRENFRYLPDSVKIRWGKASKEFSESPIDSASQLYAEWAIEMISYMKEAGVVIMAGTDSPIAFLTPGFSLHEELSLLVEGGLSPLQALEAATLRPAQYFEMEDQLGTIEVGKLADLVMLNANPLEDISNTKSIQAVVRDGYLYDRQLLNDMLDKLESSN